MDKLPLFEQSNNVWVRILISKLLMDFVRKYPSTGIQELKNGLESMKRGHKSSYVYHELSYSTKFVDNLAERFMDDKEFYTEPNIKSLDAKYTWGDISSHYGVIDNYGIPADLIKDIENMGLKLDNSTSLPIFNSKSVNTLCLLKYTKTHGFVPCLSTSASGYTQNQPTPDKFKHVIDQMELMAGMAKRLNMVVKL